MPEPGFVLIIHPDQGPDTVSEVPESSLPQWYRAGWRPLADGDLPAPATPEDAAPEPMTRAQAARTAAKTAKAAPDSEEK